MPGDLIDELIERVRVASFEAPNAQSHTAWAGRLRAMFGECCSECGVSRDTHTDIIHESEDNDYDPLVFYRPLVQEDTDGE